MGFSLSPRRVEQRFEATVGGEQVLGNDVRLAEHGHEGGVPVPAGHDLEMQVRGDARPGGLAQVEPGVDAVGPEGGFTSEEVARAEAAGWRPVRLGTTAMRAETAAMVLPAILAYEWGEDDEDKS